MHTHRTSLFVALGLGLGTSLASANGFNVNEHDGLSTGRGGAVAASNTGPSSIVFSPGGIAVGDGTQVSISGTLYIAQGSYEDSEGVKTETDQSPAIVPSAYVTSRLHKMVAVGLGFHAPFGLAISWPDQHAQADVIQDESLRTFFITPSIGINLNEQVPGLSVGGGVDIVPATVELEQAVIFGDTVGSAQLGADAIGIGGRVGVMYHPPQVAGLKLGVMWRSPVKLGFEGNGDFDIAAPYRSQLPPDGQIKTSITLPMSVWGGVGYSPLENLELELDVVWLDWSTFDTLTIEVPGGGEIVAPEDYSDTVTWRAGAEYAVPRWTAAFRAGYIYDPTPIPATTQTAQLPDIDRHVVTVGGSKWFGDYGVHLGLLWVMPGERDASNEQYMPIFKATYGVQAFVPNLSVTGKFGR